MNFAPKKFFSTGKEAMSENPELPYTLEDEQIAASVMAYTPNSLVWGEVIVRKIVRVSTWLRTNSAPDDICLYNARVLFTGTSAIKPFFMTELHIPTASIWAFHLIPPAKDPVDYDPSEPNRVMQPITAIVSNFRIDGSLRMSTKATLSKYLEISKENFCAVYDADISSPLLPALGIIKVAYIIVRQANTIIATRPAPNINKAS
jgi:hypothetical protein